MNYYDEIRDSDYYERKKEREDAKFYKDYEPEEQQDELDAEERHADMIERMRSMSDPYNN